MWVCRRRLEQEEKPEFNAAATQQHCNRPFNGRTCPTIEMCSFQVRLAPLHVGQPLFAQMTLELAILWRVPVLMVPLQQQLAAEYLAAHLARHHFVGLVHFLVVDVPAQLGFIPEIDVALRAAETGGHVIPTKCVS